MYNNSEYDGLLVAEDEEPRSGRGSKGRKAAGGGGAGAGRKWGKETAAPPFFGTVVLIIPAKLNHSMA